MVLGRAAARKTTGPTPSGGASASSPPASSGAATPSGGASASSPPASTRACITPQKDKGKHGGEIETVLNRWTPEKSSATSKLSPSLPCNRPRCKGELVKFTPPGSNPITGVSFGKCTEPDCAGGGSILAFRSTCFVCNRAIAPGSVCLSLVTEPKVCKNLHLRNCLLDTTPGTDEAAVVRTASATDIGKNCVTCTKPDPTIKDGDFLLSTAPAEARLHFECARAKRKELKGLIFNEQDRRHAAFLKKDVQARAEKKSKTASTVNIADLPADSDEDDL